MRKFIVITGASKGSVRAAADPLAGTSQAFRLKPKVLGDHMCKSVVL